MVERGKNTGYKPGLHRHPPIKTHPQKREKRLRRVCTVRKQKDTRSKNNSTREKKRNFKKRPESCAMTDREKGRCPDPETRPGKLLPGIRTYRLGAGRALAVGKKGAIGMK